MPTIQSDTFNGLRFRGVDRRFLALSRRVCQRRDVFGTDRSRSRRDGGCKDCLPPTGRKRF